MEACVDDQAHGPQYLVVQMPIILIGIGVEAEFVAEALRIERPALDISGVAAEALKRGKLLILLRQADLEMMTRPALVQEQGFVTPGVARGQVVAVVVEDSGTRPVRRPLIVFAPRRSLLAIGRVGPDLEPSSCLL